VIDSYAWVEYATAGPAAEKVSEVLDSDEELATPASVIAELKESMLRHKIEKNKIEAVLEYIRSRSQVISIESIVAEEAGRINYENKKKIKGWDMLDSFVYASALLNDAKVLTGDPHFKGMKNVVYIDST